MSTTTCRLRAAARTVAFGAGAAAAVYGATAGIAWWRYGAPAPPDSEAGDPVLDRFIPEYEVVERHHIRVEAPAAITLAAAREHDLFGSPLVRSIFRMREVVLGTAPESAPRPRALLPQMLSLGWGVLAEVPGHEIVVGAVTKPWEPNVVFRALPPDAFAGFGEPGYVRIAWSLRADPAGARASIFRTETRAVATDAVSRARFRRYWALASPGIGLIRRLLLRPLKSEAERRAREAGSNTQILQMR
jgi:hypothetical protein